jgi:excisionase family DNA binding protein
MTKLLDITEAAERLCVKERFIRRLVAEKRVPYYKVGPFVRFDPADIDQWLLDCRVDGGETG